MWNLKDFESIYSRYESSGLKVRDFCTNEVIINEAKFYYWQKKLRVSKLPSASFVFIVPVSNSTDSDLPYTVNTDSTAPVMLPPEYEILYPSGITLRLKALLFLSF